MLDHTYSVVCERWDVRGIVVNDGAPILKREFARSLLETCIGVNFAVCRVFASETRVFRSAWYHRRVVVAVLNDNHSRCSSSFDSFNRAVTSRAHDDGDGNDVNQVPRVQRRLNLIFFKFIFAQLDTINHVSFSSFAYESVMFLFSVSAQTLTNFCKVNCQKFVTDHSPVYCLPSSSSLLSTLYECSKVLFTGTV